MTTLAPSLLIGPSLYFRVARITIKSRMGSKFGKIRPGTEELAALKRLKNPHSLIMEEMLRPLKCLHILNGSSSFLLVTRTIIKAWTSLNFDKIPLLAWDLAALEHLKDQKVMV